MCGGKRADLGGFLDGDAGQHQRLALAPAQEGIDLGQLVAQRALTPEQVDAMHTEATDIVRAAGGEATFVKADVSSEADAKAALARYNPQTGQFKTWKLPTGGVETPYALNVDRRTDTVWICGTASDTLMSFDPASERFTVYPLPTRVTFTREIDFDKSGAGDA